PLRFSFPGFPFRTGAAPPGVAANATGAGSQMSMGGNNSGASAASAQPSYAQPYGAPAMMAGAQVSAHNNPATLYPFNPMAPSGAAASLTGVGGTPAMHMPASAPSMSVTISSGPSP